MSVLRPIFPWSYWYSLCTRLLLRTGVTQASVRHVVLQNVNGHLLTQRVTVSLVAFPFTHLMRYYRFQGKGTTMKLAKHPSVLWDSFGLMYV